ncbi:glycoside hydrolase family 6 protein [Streptomyces sp. NPDC060184]|uniref:glycoside hydrolase family 6 protein n=1 Tax=Streptomyces sp. NPDC060184 TaxID=3347064 RepID=UPI0036605967
MSAAAALVVAAAVAAAVPATGAGDGRATAPPGPSAVEVPVPLPGGPTSAPPPSPSPTRLPRGPVPGGAGPSPSAAPRSPSPSGPSSAAPASGGAAGLPELYRYPDSQLLEWISGHRDDPLRPVLESRIASMPTAVWFTSYDPATITGRVAAVTRAASAAGRTPVLVPYAIAGRDCGGASGGGAPDLASYDTWMRAFAAGLRAAPVIVVLEPDAVADSDCLTATARAARFASLARAARTLHAANPRARVYYDGGHSAWNGAARQAALLREAGAAEYGDGIFTNVSNFRATADEAVYARRVLDALGGPPGTGAVIDTSRNGNGAPADDAWCDPPGRALGRAPTTRTGEPRIDAYLWVKLPGESDGCSAEAGEFSPEYAYGLATG